MSLSSFSVAFAHSARDAEIEALLSGYFHEPYHTVFRAGGFYQNGGHFLGDVDILMPIAQERRALWFGDIRVSDDNNSGYEVNLGLGYRHVSPNNRWLTGYYVFYDWRHTEFDNTFQQLSAGFERKSRDWSFIGNAYVPIGKIDRRDDEFNKITLVNTGNGDDLFNILLAPGFERSLYGGDFEVGHSMPHIDGLSAFLAGYAFGGTHVKPRIGPRLRIEYDLHQFSGKWTRWLNDVDLEAMVQHDKPRGFDWYVGLRLAYHFKTPMPLIGARKHMLDYVRRDTHIVTAGNDQHLYQYLIKNADDTFTTVGVATDTITFSDSCNKSPDVITVRGDITVPSGNLPCQMSVAQVLTGGLYYAADGSIIRLSDGGSVTASSAVSGGIMHLAQDNIIRDMTLTNFDGNPAITNNGSDAVGALTIYNTTLGGGVHITIDDGSTDSVIDFRHNDINIIGTDADGFSLTLKNSPTSAKLKYFSDNHIVYEGAAGFATTFRTERAATLNIRHPFERNSVQFETGTNAIGYLFQVNNGGKLNFNNHGITNNQMTTGATIGSEGIIFEISDINSAVNNLGLISNNAVNFQGASNGNIGIHMLATNGAVIDMNGNGITDNQLIFGNDGQNVGISLSAVTDSTLILGDITDNLLTIAGGNESKGINFYASDNSATHIGNIQSNTITIGSGNTNIGLQGETSNNGELSLGNIQRNTITLATGDKNIAADFYADDGELTVGGINENTMTLGLGKNNFVIHALAKAALAKITFGDIGYNQLHFNGNLNTGLAAMTENAGKLSIQSIHDNFIKGNNGNGITGIALNIDSTSMAATSINNNTILFDGNAGTGIQIHGSAPVAAPITNTVASTGNNNIGISLEAGATAMTIISGDLKTNTILLTGDGNIGIAATAKLGDIEFGGDIKNNEITITGDDGIGMDLEANGAALSFLKSIKDNVLVLNGSNGFGLMTQTQDTGLIDFEIATGEGLLNNVFTFDVGTSNTGILVKTNVSTDKMNIYSFKGNVIGHLADTVPPSEDIALESTVGGTTPPPYEINITVNDGTNGLNAANTGSDVGGAAVVTMTGNSIDASPGF